MTINSSPLKNPLLDFSSFPRFNEVLAEHVMPAMDELIARASAALDSVLNSVQEPGWESVVGPLELPLEQLGRAWGCVSHLQAVVDTPELRAAFNAS